MYAIKILIVEDEFIIARNLQVILEDLGYEPYEPVGTKYAAIAALNELEIDLVILDINLAGRQEGIELGKYINDHFQLPFIYLTSNSDKITIDLAKTTYPKSYLIKPFTSEDIYAAIEMAVFKINAIQAVQPSQQTASFEPNPFSLNSLFIKIGNKYVKVKIEDITHVSADGKMVEINTVNKQKLHVKMSLEQMLLQLIKFGFIRVQRSFLVNINFITAINNETIYIDQEAIPIGRQYKDELMKYIRAIN